MTMSRARAKANRLVTRFTRCPSEIIHSPRSSLLITQLLSSAMGGSWTSRSSKRSQNLPSTSTVVGTSGGVASSLLSGSISSKSLSSSLLGAWGRQIITQNQLNMHLNRTQMRTVTTIHPGRPSKSPQLALKHNSNDDRDYDNTFWVPQNHLNWHLNLTQMRTVTTIHPGWPSKSPQLALKQNLNEDHINKTNDYDTFWGPSKLPQLALEQNSNDDRDYDNTFWVPSKSHQIGT